MARGEHSPACARRWREQAESRQWTPWQTAQAIHGCCGVSLLKAHRLARGWSARQSVQELEELCERQDLGEARASIDLLNAWENNRARPRPQTIDLLARLYRANSVRLGLAGDYCEDNGGPRSWSSRAARAARRYQTEDRVDDDMERRALFHTRCLAPGS